MGATIRELFVKLGVKADTASLTKFDRGLGKVKSGMADLSRLAVIGAAAVTAVTVAVVAATVETAAYADSIVKTAAAQALSAEEWQKMLFLAQRTGVSVEQLRVGLTTLRRNMEAAARGTGEGAEALKEFGIEVTNADGTLKSQEQILKELAEAYNQMEDPIKRAALLTRIFGESGGALGPLLAEGAEGIEELMQRAEDLGIIMSEEQLEAATALTDAMTDLWGIIGAIKNRIFLALAPTLTELINQFAEWWLANRELMEQRLDEWVESFTDKIEIASVWVARLVEFFGGLEVVVAAALAAGSALLTGFLSVKVLLPVVTIVSGLVSILSALAGILGVGLATAAGVVALAFAQILIIMGLLAVAGALAILWIQDFYTFLNGGDSVIGRFLESLGLSERALNTFWSAIASGIDIGRASVEVLYALWNLFGMLAGVMWDQASPAVLFLWDLFMQFVGWLGGSAFDSLDGWITKIDSVAMLLREVAGLINQIAGVDVSANASLSTGGDAVARSANGATNTVNQENNFEINGAGDPNVVGAVIADQVTSLLKQTGAAFTGGDV